VLTDPDERLRARVGGNALTSVSPDGVRSKRPTRRLDRLV
jgi:hypothetical protein